MGLQNFSINIGNPAGSVVPYVSGSGTWSTMNATTGSDGQLFYNTTYKHYFKWTVDRWWPFGYPDPRYGFVLAWEDFGGNDRIGTLDWGANSSMGAGAQLIMGVANVSQSAQGGVSRMSPATNHYQLGTGDFYIETIMTIPTLSNGTDNATYVWGFNDGTSYDANGACTDGAYFSLDYAVDTTHLCTNTTSNTTNTQKVSVIAAGVPTAATPIRLGIFVQASTSVTFYVNGTAITAAHTTNIPVGAGRQTGFTYLVHKALGAGALSLAVDGFWGWGFWNGQRVA